jgi:hypothetical protein
LKYTATSGEESGALLVKALVVGLDGATAALSGPTMQPLLAEALACRLVAVLAATTGVQMGVALGVWSAEVLGAQSA